MGRARSVSGHFRGRVAGPVRRGVVPEHSGGGTLAPPTLTVISLLQLKKGPPVPPPPKVTPTKEVAEEQIIDFFGGEFLPAPSPLQVSVCVRSFY